MRSLIVLAPFRFCRGMHRCCANLLLTLLPPRCCASCPHASQGRDFIGGSYKAHDNRGTATKDRMPIMHPGPDGNYPIKTQPSTTSAGSLIFSQDPFSSKGGDRQHDYGVTTTAPVPARIEKVLSGDLRDMSDAENRESAFDQEGAGQWIMAGYTGHVRAPRSTQCRLLLTLDMTVSVLTRWPSLGGRFQRDGRCMAHLTVNAVGAANHQPCPSRLSKWGCQA